MEREPSLTAPRPSLDVSGAAVAAELPEGAADQEEEDGGGDGGAGGGGGDDGSRKGGSEEDDGGEGGGSKGGGGDGASGDGGGRLVGKVAAAIRVEARAVETTKTTEMTDRVRERGAGMRGGEGGVCDGRRGTVGWAGARTRKSWWQQVPAGGVPPIANRCVVAVGPEGHIEPRHGCWTRSSGASGGSRLLMTGGC